MSDAVEYKPSTNEEDAYKDRLKLELERQNQVLENIDANVGWMPQDGSQVAFFETDWAFEVLYEGTRGGGKSDCLLMDFARGVGQGHGEVWRGVLFRQTYPQLADIVAKIMRWFPVIFGDGFKFNHQSKTVTFKTGEQLLLRHMKRVDDYWNYHGHEYPWIGWEELTNWPNMDCYKRMISCCRVAKKGVPRRIRSTTNPYGVGHNAVKQYFRLPQQSNIPQRIIMQNLDGDGHSEHYRLTISSSIDENKILLASTPDYKNQLANAARNPAEAEAWIKGSWTIVAGGMFDDIWAEGKDHFCLPPFEIPKTWRWSRSFDWGASKPFSVAWYVESDGATIEFDNRPNLHTLKGDLFRVREWYGCQDGQSNKGLDMVPEDIAEGIIERELKWGIYGRVKRGVADSAIFDDSVGKSIADQMRKKVTIDGVAYKGIYQLPCVKGAGSRVNGWQQCRQLLKNAIPDENGQRETKGFFVVKLHNPHFCAQIPTLPRDDDNMDDVDTLAEDHIADEWRYRLTWAEPRATSVDA